MNTGPFDGRTIRGGRVVWLPQGPEAKLGRLPPGGTPSGPRSVPPLLTSRIPSMRVLRLPRPESSATPWGAAPSRRGRPPERGGAILTAPIATNVWNDRPYAPCFPETTPIRGRESWCATRSEGGPIYSSPAPGDWNGSIGERGSTTMKGTPGPALEVRRRRPILKGGEYHDWK